MRKQTDMEIGIPVLAGEIINKLDEHGYGVYMVDGYIRDMLLGRELGGWDTTISALPGQVKEVFRRIVDTGIQYGTVTVMMGKEGYKVTTYRIDGRYSDGRHPDSTELTPDLVEDLERRDFTINIMAYNSHMGFVGKLGDVEGLEKGIIRCVGEPMDRFTEDALRVLRVIRFSAQLGSSIEERTYEAIRTIAPSMIHVNREWIQVELTKLLLSFHPDYILRVYETGVSPYAPEKFHGAYTGESGNWAVPSAPAGIPAVKHVRWATFLRDRSASRAADILKDLKPNNGTIHKVRTLVERQGKKVGLQNGMEDGMRDTIKSDRGLSRVSIRHIMSQMKPEPFDNLLTLKMCLPKAASNDEELRRLRQVRDLIEEIHRNRDCINLKTLAVSGYDIMGAGVKPDREVGSTLTRFLDMVLEEPQRNTKEYLLAHPKQKKGRAGI